MTDKDDPNLTMPPQNRPSGGIRAGITKQFDAMDIPPEKHDAKIKEAATWWTRAAVCGFVTLLFLSGASYVVYLQREGLTILLLIALSVPVGLPALATLFCASQADGEATKAFVQTILALRGATKKDS